MSEQRSAASRGARRPAGDRSLLRPDTGAPLSGAGCRGGAELFVKHENHLPTGAFKIRGGINLAARLGSEQRAAGVYAPSTGNHGQSVAYAASLFDIAATIFVPRGANPVKVSSMRSLGGTVIEHGVDFDEARERCDEVAVARRARYIHSGNEPLLIAGVATATLELHEREPSIDVIVVPVGGGSSLSISTSSFSSAMASFAPPRCI